MNKKTKNYQTVIIIFSQPQRILPGVSVYEGDGYITPMG